MKKTYFKKAFLPILLLIICGTLQAQHQPVIKDRALQKGLVGYWKLSGDLKDHSGKGLHPAVHGQLKAGEAFNGRDAWLEVSDQSVARLGKEDFTISAWINVPSAMDDIPGDIVSLYDRSSGTGFHLSLQSYASITSQANYRKLSFGMDNGSSAPWVDYGRPGNALLAFGMVEYQGELYAGTCEPGPNDRGHVYRYAGDSSWIDCGSPDGSNSVAALAVMDGQLYAGTGRYRVAGSSLPESENQLSGGRVFRYGGSPGQWIDCGQLPGVEMIGGMIVYKGKLYVSSMYAPAALFRYEGGQQWVRCPVPDGKRVVNMTVHNGYLYASSWDVGNIYRYDGTSWTDCGLVGENTQNYGFAVYEGGLYTATWPSGRVYRFDGLDNWKDVGRLGQELEVMGMAVHNGRLIGGTLPLAEVYEYEGDTTWSLMARLDKTPDVRYRRAWAMAEHGGQLFCSTLPSGRIYGYKAGVMVSADDELSPGWQHVLVSRKKGQLRLYVNGQLVKEVALSRGLGADPGEGTSLKIGFGPNDYFYGQMREVRLYKRALNEKEVRGLYEIE